MNQLRQANMERQLEWSDGDALQHPLLRLAFKALEVADEAGEVAGAVKKVLRARLGIKGSLATVEDVEEEIGDVLVACDLLAEYLGLPTLDVIAAKKFNKTSEKYGFKTRMEV